MGIEKINSYWIELDFLEYPRSSNSSSLNSSTQTPLCFQLSLLEMLYIIEDRTLH